MRKSKVVACIIGALVFALSLSAVAVTSTPAQYTPYFQTSALWSMLDSHGSDLQDLNANYLGNTYGITAMYAGMFLTTNSSCDISSLTTAAGSFNPLNNNYGSPQNPNWLGQFHGDVSLVIGGDPGTSLRDFLDICQPSQFAAIVSNVITQFNAQQSSQPAKLIGIVFDVENASFHNGNAWAEIAAAIDANPTMQYVIAIHFHTDYWNDGWTSASFTSFLANYGSKISEINILDNDQTTAVVSGAKNYMNTAYAELGKYGIPATKISLMLDVSMSNLDANSLSQIQQWLNGYTYNGSPVNSGIHLFSRDKDANNLLGALLAGAVSTKDAAK